MILALILRHRIPIALAAALVGLTLASWHYRSAYHAEKALRQALIASVQAASAQAAIDQQAANRVPAILSKVIAENSDAQSPAYYADVRAAAERMRKDGPRCPGPAGVPAADYPAPIDDGSAHAASVVSRPKADDDLIVAAAGRAAQMHADAEALIAAGVAKAAD